MIQEYTRDKQDSVWETEDIKVTYGGNYISESIRRGKAVAVSDGSHKGEYTAAAMTIEGPRVRYKRIVGIASSPGHPEGKDSYIRELT